MPFKSVSIDPTPWPSTKFSWQRWNPCTSTPCFPSYTSCVSEDITRNAPCSESMATEVPPLSQSASYGLSSVTLPLLFISSCLCFLCLLIDCIKFKGYHMHFELPSGEKGLSLLAKRPVFFFIVLCHLNSFLSSRIWWEHTWGSLLSF